MPRDANEGEGRSSSWWILLAVLAAAACGGSTAAGPAEKKPDLVACTPASGPEIVVEAQDTNAIAIDATYLYWATKNELRRVPKAGGTIERLATAPDTDPFNTWGIEVDDESVYVGTATHVVRVPTIGGPPQELASVAGEVVAMDPTTVYAVDGHGSWAISKNGGASLLSSTPSTSLTSDATHVYGAVWSPGEVVAIPRGGGAKRTVGTAVDSSWITNDDDHVYFAYEQGIASISKSDGARVQLVQQILVRELKVDDRFIYFTVSAGSAGEKVAKVPKAGGPVVDVVPLGSVALAVDECNVYFTIDRCRGTPPCVGADIMRAPK